MRYAIALTFALVPLALSAPANAQTAPSGKYCLTGNRDAGASGNVATANCSFQTMAACENAKTRQTDKCMPNSLTTGSGSGMKDNSTKQ